MRPLFLCLCAVACVGSSAFAQLNSGPLQIQEHVLDNGFTILLVEDHRRPRVAANLWVRVGSMAEPVGQHGITHFLEHVIHQGTTTVGTTDLAAERPILQQIHDTEQELIAARNRERNQLRERAVFYDELGWPVTPEIEALRERLYELEDRDDGVPGLLDLLQVVHAARRVRAPHGSGAGQHRAGLHGDEHGAPQRAPGTLLPAGGGPPGQCHPEGLGGAAFHRAGADPRGKEPATDPLQRGNRRRHRPGPPGLRPRRRARPRLREFHPGCDVPDLRRLLRAQQRGAGAGRRRDT